MGFLCVDIEVPKLMAGLLNLIAHVRFMVMVSLSYLGLFDQLFPWGHDPDAFLSAAGNFSAFAVPSATTLSPVMLENVKRRLPVVEYGDFLDRSSLEVVEDSSEEGAVVCAVCLGCLERGHEIRELSNCCHAFHRECLDKWVDESQVTCPLCRSPLLPSRIHVLADNEEEMMRNNGGGHTWLVDRISYLFGEDL